MDFIAELGNTLFGVYLMSLHKNWNLTVYQDIPESSLMDAEQSVLQRIQTQGGRASNVAVAIEISYMIEKSALKAWLVLLPQMDGLSKILDGMDAFGGVSSNPVRVPRLSDKAWGMLSEKVVG